MSVGSALRAARDASGLTLADVSRQTRIRATLIGQIEADDWEACGGAVYARGHIRAIAAAVGADPAPLVADFDAEHGAPGPIVLRDALEESTGGPEIRERRGPNWLAAAVGAAAVATVLIAVSVATGAGGGGGDSVEAGPGPAQTAASPAPALPASPAAGQPVPPAASSPAPLIAQRAPVVVRVKVTKAGGSWVLATSPGKTFPPGAVLDQGATAEFSSDKPIKLVLGSAGRVELTVNGRAIGSPGSVGEVFNGVFDATTGQG